MEPLKIELYLNKQELKLKLTWLELIQLKELWLKVEEEEEELLDYEEEDVAKTTTLTASKDGEKKGEKNKKKGYVGMHSTGFRDFLLKPELLRAIVDCGFEHPSEG